ncbi:MAG: DUF6516 family protein [bacterium]|nr:DUF6516 family protein [bacterium]
MARSRDPGLEALLPLDGEVFFVDPDGKYYVKFVVKAVPEAPERPHGLNYSLTLHGPDGQRLVGFDNAHPVSAQTGPAGRKLRSQDHRHRLKTIRPYGYKDAATLLSDFWEQVESVLKEKGVKL